MNNEVMQLAEKVAPHAHDCMAICVAILDDESDYEHLTDTGTCTCGAEQIRRAIVTALAERDEKIKILQSQLEWTSAHLKNRFEDGWQKELDERDEKIAELQAYWDGPEYGEGCADCRDAAKEIANRAHVELDASERARQADKQIATLATALQWALNEVVGEYLVTTNIEWKQRFEQACAALKEIPGTRTKRCVTPGCSATSAGDSTSGLCDMHLSHVDFAETGFESDSAPEDGPEVMVILREKEFAQEAYIYGE